MRVGLDAMRGAPARPSASTSQPARRSNPCRAAARQVKLAAWHPVTKPTELSRGRSSTSSNQSAATCSTTAAQGEVAYRPAFWSSVEVSQSLASATGYVPPMTKPK